MILNKSYSSVGRVFRINEKVAGSIPAMISIFQSFNLITMPFYEVTIVTTTTTTFLLDSEIENEKELETAMLDTTLQCYDNLSKNLCITKSKKSSDKIKSVIKKEPFNLVLKGDEGISLDFEKLPESFTKHFHFVGFFLLKGISNSPMLEKEAEKDEFANLALKLIKTNDLIIFKRKSSLVDISPIRIVNASDYAVYCSLINFLYKEAPESIVELSDGNSEEYSSEYSPFYDYFKKEEERAKQNQSFFTRIKNWFSNFFN